MPKITFSHDHLTVDVSAGTPLMAVVEKFGATLPFGCRKGSCGTCRCIVRNGGQNLNEKTKAELRLFKTLTAVDADERLACQVVVEGDAVIEA